MVNTEPSHWYFLAQNQTSATYVMSFERLTHMLYDDITHDTDKVQNLQKSTVEHNFRNGLIAYIV